MPSDRIEPPILSHCTACGHAGNCRDDMSCRCRVCDGNNPDPREGTRPWDVRQTVRYDVYLGRVRAWNNDGTLVGEARLAALSALRAALDAEAQGSRTWYCDVDGLHLPWRDDA